MNERIHLRIRNAVREIAPELRRLSARIHDNPEVGFEEVRACAWQTALLRKWGFNTKTRFAGLATAYRAVLGAGKPVFCMMSEYDALPSLGHACGHNLICAAALGAGHGLARVMKEDGIPGTVVIMGTPAEESLGGKIMLMKKGALKGIDAVLMAHPSFRTIPDTGSTAIVRREVTFIGKSAHAAASPEKGRNALDAVTLFFQGINAWRQHLPETSRIHGIITEGGVAPNIIPDRAGCVFFLRSLRDAALKPMMKRFTDIARGAALMTGTQAVFGPCGMPYRARWPNKSLNEAYVDAAGGAGLKVATPEHSGRGSSDFGNVSQTVPGAHVYFGIAKEAIALHSVDFEKAAGSGYAFRQMLRAAEAMAVVGHRYVTESEFRKRVREDFAADRKRARAVRAGGSAPTEA